MLIVSNLTYKTYTTHRSFQFGNDWKISMLKLGRNDHLGKTIDINPLLTPNGLCIKVEHPTDMISSMKHLVDFTLGTVHLDIYKEN